MAINRKGKARTWPVLVKFTVTLLGAFGFLTALTLWPWRVEPPALPLLEPAVAYVADYGRHSRLAVQINDQSMVEYSFGDWRYYARGEFTLWRGFIALATPTQATLGKRPLPIVPDEEGFNKMTGAKRSARIEVEQSKMDALLAELQSRYQKNITTEIEANWTDMTFVKDDTPYNFFRNSNHQTAKWLRDLGCKTGGAPMLSNFRVEER